MRSLGDLVVMALPTDWTPEVQSPVIPQPGYQQNFPINPYGGGDPGGYPAYPMFPAEAYAGLPPGSASGLPGVPLGYGGGAPGAPGAAGAGPGGLQIPRPIVGTPGGNWNQPYLPDSVLPMPLRRTNPLLGRQSTVWQPGPWDHDMIREAKLWGWIKQHGGIKSCCHIPELGAPIYNQPPWIVMPSNAEKFEQGFGVATPVAPFTGLDVLLGTFQVPDGWDGVITRFVPNFTGNGFQDYSNNIFWRLLINNRFAPDLGNVNTTFGSLTGLISVPGINNIRLISGQNISIFFNIPVGSPVAGGMITAVCFGWFYPRR
jgi:hypothetical protein